ncbi:MAG TPA: hypothetical protein VI588_01155, partial [Candidatus Gracilibacteria bacterium]|nr:hypothetical protein [Candidatus Gracilibacteria bacterium]
DKVVTAGTVIGTVFDLNVPGERDHLHLGICKGAYKTSKNTGGTCSPQGGALDKSSFPGNYVNPWITTNPGLYK